MKYEIWAGRGGHAIGYLLIPATDAKRREMRQANPGAMEECIATFKADSWDQATARYEEMYEDLATAWEAKNQGPD